MLSLVSGRAGSGKSGYLLREIQNLAGGEAPVFLLVPEQFSHESERDITLYLGNKTASFIEVLSFKRLARYTFERCGFAKLSYLDDGGRNLMMAKAITGAGDELKVYRRASMRPELTMKFLSLITELKSYNITPDMLFEVAKEIKDPGFRDKISDIHLIYSIYEGLLVDSFADPADDLTRLAFALENSKIFENSHFFLDSFKGFTPQEYGVLALLMERCASMWVGLCCGGDMQESRTVFKTTEQTKRTLIKMAARRMIETKEITLQPNHTCAAEISHLEQNIFSLKGEKFPGKCAAIRLFSGKDVFSQAEFAARQILHLVHTKNYRYSDFVIITRDMQQYGDIFETALKRHGISVYMDKKTALLSKPVIALLISAMEVIGRNFMYEDVFSYLRTYLTDLSLDDIDLFETYIYTLDIKRDAMLRPFTYVPDRICKAFGDAENLLPQLNAIRDRFVKPLLALREYDGKTAEEITKGIYKFLIDLGVPKNIEERGEELLRAGAPEEAAEYGQLWDLLMNVLDQMVLVSSCEKMNFDTYTRLLRIILEQYDTGSIPTVFDRVTIGSAERIRVSGEKCVFLVGFNESIFPKSDFEQGLISDSQKKKLERAGLMLSATGQERIFDELFFVYCAVTAGSERLFITWCENGKAGLRPSYLLGRIRALFPDIEEDDASFFDDPAYIYAGEAAFEYMLTLSPRQGVRTALEAYFSQKKGYETRISEIEGANQAAAKLHFENPKTAERLYGKDLIFSPTRIEIYQNCRFAHFMKYGLAVNPRRQIAFDALETGTFIHYVLERFAALFDDDFLREENLPLREKEVGRIVSEYVSDIMKAQIDTSRFHYLFIRLKSVVSGVCEFLVKEFRESRFRPIEFELKIGDNSGVSPVVLSDGEMTVKITGKVDRVDGFEKGNTLYIRVVDYKTGSKTFRLADAYNGLNLQMLLYLFTLGETGSHYFGKEVERAGVLYMPANFEAIAAKRTESDEEIQKKHEKELSMNGLVIDDMDVLRAMEPSLSGRFIPVSLKQDGTFSAYSSVASKRQFNLLKKHTEKILLKMGRELLQGDIRPLPIKSCGIDSCSYCEFGAACRYDKEKGEHRQFFSSDHDTLWTEIEKEEADDVDKATAKRN